MILVDKDIDERIREKGELIDPKEYKKSNLNGVSYDLTIDVIYDVWIRISAGIMRLITMIRLPAAKSWCPNISNCSRS